MGLGASWHFIFRLIYNGTPLGVFYRFRILGWSNAICLEIQPKNMLTEYLRIKSGLICEDHMQMHIYDVSQCPHVLGFGIILHLWFGYCSPICHHMCDIAKFPSPRAALALFLRTLWSHRRAHYGHFWHRHYWHFQRSSWSSRPPYYVIPVSGIIPPDQGPIALFR